MRVWSCWLSTGKSSVVPLFVGERGREKVGVKGESDMRGRIELEREVLRKE